MKNTLLSTRSSPPKSSTFPIVKRALDIIGAALCLLFLAPCFLIIALAITVDSRGPICIRQKRVGKDGVIFSMLKFRSMYKNAEKATGAVWAEKKDPRITRVGRFLRKTHLDESLQLIHVLQGKMSLVGPRPERPEFMHTLRSALPLYDMRHTVKPGITGWAQINYPYGASLEDASQKLHYDLYYIANKSLIFEIKILLRTFLTLFTGRGAR